MAVSSQALIDHSEVLLRRRKEARIQGGGRDTRKREVERKKGAREFAVAPLERSLTPVTFCAISRVHTAILARPKMQPRIAVHPRNDVSLRYERTSVFSTKTTTSPLVGGS